MSNFVYLNFKSYLYIFRKALKYHITDKELVEWILGTPNLEYKVNSSTISKLINDSSKIPQKIVEAFFKEDESKIVENFVFCFDTDLDSTLILLVRDEMVDLIRADTTIAESIKADLISKSRKTSFKDLIRFLAYVFIYVIKSNNVVGNRSSKNNLSSIVEHGISEVYHDVKLIPYSQLITDATTNIDIVHIHGNSWINERRIEIREKMKDPNVTIRLLLLSPSSPFFEACGNFLPYYTEDDMLSKLKTALKTWERSYFEATNGRTTSGAKFHVYLTQQFPTKSLYRFDNVMIVTPAYMGKDRVTYLPTLCCKSQTQPENFFAAYLREIEEIVKDHDLFLDATNTPLHFDFSRYEKQMKEDFKRE